MIAGINLSDHELPFDIELLTIQQVGKSGHQVDTAGLSQGKFHWSNLESVFTVLLLEPWLHNQEDLAIPCKILQPAISVSPFPKSYERLYE
jgi:hypothetical protein